MSENKGKRAAVLFVHGIVGNNHIFDFLRPIVPDSYMIKHIDLKGHGGNALAFSQASMAQWQGQIEEALSQMSGQYDTIIGVGHSMGCLLLMEQAVKNKISGLFLLNPPLKIRLGISFFGNTLKVASGRIKKNPVLQAAKDAYGVSLDFNPFHYYGWPKRYAELFGAIRRVRKSVIPQIRIPVKAVLSAKDEMVSISSQRYFDRLTTASTIVLPSSTHYYYSDKDRETISSEFMSFLNTELPQLQLVNLSVSDINDLANVPGFIIEFNKMIRER